MFIAAEKGGDSREVLQSEKYHANIINVRGLRAWNDRVLDIQDIKWIISLSVKCFYNVFFQNIFLWSSEIVFLICSGQEIQRQQTIWRDKGRELLEKINILFWQETHLLLLDYLDIIINVDISEICQLFFWQSREQDGWDLLGDTELCYKKKNTFESFINVTTRISYSMLKIIH